MSKTTTTNLGPTMMSISSPGIRASGELLQRVRALSKRKPGQNRLAHQKQKDLLELTEEYETACALSVGPDAGRSAHWTDKARMNKARLSLMLDALDGGWPKAEQKQ